MKLIASLTSPYVRKVRIVLAEKKIVDFTVAPGQVLGIVGESGSGKSVTSLSIMRLLPASGRERISVKRWEALADGVLDAAVAAFLEARRPDGERSPSWIERQRGKVNQALKVMSDDLGDQPWCHGSGLSLADIAVGCALGYVSFRLGDIRWREQYPNLAQLYEKLMQRPAFAETVPPV